MKEITIFIKYFGKTIEFNVLNNLTINELKELIEKKENIKKEDQVLILKNGFHIYKNNLIENNIQNDETLFLQILNFNKNVSNQFLCGFIFLIKKKGKKKN